MTRLWHLVAVALLLGACGGDARFAIELSMAFDSTVDDARLAEVTTFSFSTTGDETYSYDLALGRDAKREERTRYLPSPNTRHLDITVIAKDANGVTIADGVTEPLTLVPDTTTEVPLVLSAPVEADAGVVDAATQDAGTDDAAMMMPSLCPTFTGLACQGFEDPITAPWSVHVTGAATLVEDSEKAYRGARSLQTSTPMLAAGSSAVAQVIRSTLPTEATMYMRTFVWVDALPAASFRLMSLQTQTGTYAAHALSLSTTGLVTSDTALGSSPPVAMPLGRWVCLELAVEFATGGEVRVSIDGIPRPSLTLDGDTTGSNATTEFVAGLSSGYTTAVGPYALWLDEIAIDSAPVGCSR